MVPVLIFLGLLVLLAAEVALAARLSPEPKKVGPSPLVRPEADVTAKDWNPPGVRGWEAIDGP